MKFGSLIFITMLFSNFAFAECDYSKIQKTDGGYLYTKEIHLCVGEMKQDLEVSDAQNKKYVKALYFKDIALDKADERAELWRNTSYKLEDRMQTMDSLRKTNQWIYFGLGVLTMSAAVYAAGQLR